MVEKRRSNWNWRTKKSMMTARKKAAAEEAKRQAIAAEEAKRKTIEEEAGKEASQEAKRKVTAEEEAAVKMAASRGEEVVSEPEELSEPEEEDDIHEAFDEFMDIEDDILTCMGEAAVHRPRRR